MKKLKGTYWRVVYLVLTIIALILAVGAPETTGWEPRIPFGFDRGSPGSIMRGAGYPVKPRGEGRGKGNRGLSISSGT